MVYENVMLLVTEILWQRRPFQSQHYPNEHLAKTGN